MIVWRVLLLLCTMFHILNFQTLLTLTLSVVTALSPLSVCCLFVGLLDCQWNYAKTIKQISMKLVGDILVLNKSFMILCVRQGL